MESLPTCNSAGFALAFYFVCSAVKSAFKQRNLLFMIRNPGQVLLPQFITKTAIYQQLIMYLLKNMPIQSNFMDWIHYTILPIYIYRRSPYSETGWHGHKTLAPLVLRHHLSATLPLSYDLCAFVSILYHELPE